MKRLLVTVLLLFTISASEAQLLKKVGNPLPVYNGPSYFRAPVFGMQSDGSALSVLFLRNVESVYILVGPDTLRNKFIIQISEWKNNQWDSVSSIVLLSRDNQFAPLYDSYRYNRGKYYFQLYSNLISVGDSIVGLPRQSYSTVCYNPGSGWSALIPPLPSGQKLDPYKFNNISGMGGFEFKGDTMYSLELVRHSNGLNGRTVLFRYYNSVWDSIIIPKANDSAWSNDHRLYKDGQEIYYMHSSVYGMHIIKGNSLQEITIPRLADVLNLSNGSNTVMHIKMNYKSFGKFGNEILTTNDSNGISIWNGSTFQKTTNSNSLYLRSFTKYKGKYYAVANASRNVFGNMHQYQKVLRLDGLNWVELAIPFQENDQVYFLTEHQGRLYLGGKFDTDTCIGIARLSDNLSTISGYVYRDVNNNCSRDTGEQTYSNAIVRLSPGNHLVNTDENGRYYMVVESGKYITTLIPRKWFSAVCYSEDTADLTSGDVNGADISQTKPIVSDMSVSLTGGSGNSARRGRTENYQLLLENNGNHVSYGTLTLRFGNRVTNFYCGIANTKINDSTYLFNIDSLHVNATRSIQFTTYISESNLKASDKISYSVIINPASDVDTSDNRDTLIQTVITAFDPNHKQCEPSGYIKHQISHIDYHIQFQNLGLDTAIRVRVVDSFDNKLALHKAKITGFSHPYKVELRNNVITWTFDKIQLTPDWVNYAKSQGYIAFRVYLHTPMNVGDSIINKAYIYFDYEEPVITKHASVALIQDSTVGLPPKKPVKNKGLHVYPNPTDGLLSIEFSEEGAHSIACYDLLGRMVRTFTITGKGIQNFDLSGLPAGMYAIRDTYGNTTMIVLQQ